MSKRLGCAASSLRRLVSSRCRRVPAGLRPQLRSFSDVQRPLDSAPYSRQRDSSSRAQNHTRHNSFRDAPKPSSSKLEQHLNSLFPPLTFPPELASRILTHASHPDAAYWHNARMSFIGRRVLQSYLLLFIHSSPALHPEHDYELISERALNTYVLGEHVASRWNLGKVLKWKPMNVGSFPVPLGPEVEVPEGVSQLAPRSIGLYKVHGTAVEAIAGGVFHQYGGSVAHRLFHTRVLPLILLPGNQQGLPDAFHEHALEVCERMGGPDGALIVPGQKASSTN
ncbi:hypothetical protein A0H81_03057 [Grifola frondosa]|uniref:RNase III domain-containing protein n=1 Tax=Grifola frondosa TaxID=5627 RepID=A0A1C7MJE0_GRIFR|nr:hypothetical protein A0H81_03057 [Grifola frondosa]